jgi:hypothetical protein
LSISSVSFWQQDANYWNRAQARDQSLAQSALLMSVISNAMTTESQGLASIANQTALNRVNTALSGAIQSALQTVQGGSSASGGSTSSSSSTNSTSTSSSSSSAAPVPISGAPAIGTGTTPLTASTPLLSLGVIPSGTITVSDNTFTTTYTATGTDTVGDLVNTLNSGQGGNANVAAWIDGSGHLVISGKTTYDTITVGGVYASALGFGSGNDSFAATPPSSPTASTASSSASTPSAGTSASSGTGSASSSPYSGLHNSSPSLQTVGTAAILLASSGAGGSLVNLLV